MRSGPEVVQRVAYTATRSSGRVRSHLAHAGSCDRGHAVRSPPRHHGAGPTTGDKRISRCQPGGHDHGREQALPRTRPRGG